MSRILDQIREYDAIIFSTYAAMVDDVADVLRSGIPENREAVASYFRHLLRRGSASGFRMAWAWIFKRSLADDRLFSSYIDAMSSGCAVRSFVGEGLGTRAIG